MNDDKTIPTDPDGEQTLPLDPADRIGQFRGLPEVIGPYRLVRSIGQGGMGEVFEAEQTEPIRRRVALKVIKQGMDTRSVVARFDAERQALAMMDHPCIAKVYDAGATEQGRPYFAMEFVEGESISRYCNRKKLGVNERLNLFVQVCEGVQHAHQKAVIHRDLKPSNILVTEVDGRPLPKIIDFGVAKATTQRLTEMTMFTELGQMVGTPEYMSPEQAMLTEDDIDTRTDVYALGVVLYELLSGALPFDSKILRKAGYDAIRKIICEEEPPRPSTRFSSLGAGTKAVAEAHSLAPNRLKGELKGDLDWITMKALEKDRDRRYETANGLAADVQRHLKHEPVTAGPPTAGYRISKFLRRNQAGVAIASVAVVALLAFAVTSTLQAKLIARERDRATAEAAKTLAMNEFLGQTLASVDPWSGGSRDATVVQALDAAVLQIDSAFENQPEVEASMRTMLGETYLGLGKLPPATEQIERAMQIRLAQEDLAPHELGLLRLVEARLHQKSAQHEEAVLSAAEAGRIFQIDPEAELENRLNAHQLEARNYLYLQRFAEAESLLQISEKLASGPEGQRLLVSAENYNLQADLFMERDGNAAAADSLARLAFDHSLAIDPENSAAATYLNNAAQFHSRSGDLEGALADFDQALALYEKHFGTDHPEYAVCLENRGGVLYGLKRPEETFAALEEVHDIRSRNLGPDHIDVIRTGLNMGTVSSLAGNDERALEIFGELKPVLIEARGFDHPDVLAVLRNEGLALRRLGRYDEALADFEDAVGIAQRLYRQNHWQIARAQLDLGIMLTLMDRIEPAEENLLASYRIFSSELGPEHINTRDAANTLVQFYEKIGENKKADPYRLEE